ncbi:MULTISPECIES: FG-GAP repeat domain-containing protein [unclassified Streptomyces]|uniref:FG-GAP repeat domain-containing protein n=1 Tax=unclassified Streptomyces TaxID=2593676 RepID=UPI0006AF7FD8|nr:MULTISPECIES: VCBS repeat-containing protein [unclassified Streptomyces]
MSHVRTPRRRLAAAVVALLAVTGGGLAAPAASAAPSGPAPAVVSADPAEPRLVEQSVPGTMDFSGKNGVVELMWRFDAPALVKIELTHTASGKRKTDTAYTTDDGLAVMRWIGVFDDFTAAYNGGYTWRLTVTPRSAAGPSTERTGTFEVDSGQAPHDFSDSGSPDLLVRADGSLYVFDGRKGLEFDHTDAAIGTNAGPGWDAYDRIVAPGDVGGGRFSDLVARDRTGTLWVHPGTGIAASPFAQRVRVGGGWQVYAEVTGGSDLDGDGRPDLVAADKSGGLWFYKGTGNVAAPFAPRRKTGYGWGIYDKLVATGNIGGAAAGDLVARDRNGVLWLYLGKGDGTFAPRARVGAGWDAYNEIVAIGDTDRDGRPDLIANGRTGRVHSSLALYRGTGNWKAPFAPRTWAAMLLPVPGWSTQLF